MENQPSGYWDDRESALAYYNCSKNYLQNYEETAVTMILEYYRHRHPEWVPGQSKIPLIADVGCGSGQLSVRLAEHCERLIGVDISNAQIELAKEVNARPNIEYVVGMAENLSEICSLDSVDLITVGTAVHYFNKDNNFFEEFKNCLRSGGVFVIVAYINWGIDHADEYYQTYFLRMWHEYSVNDSQLLRAIRLHANSFRDIGAPLGSSFDERIVWMRWSSDDVKGYFSGLSQLLKKGSIEKLIERLPDMETFEVSRRVFCIQWYKLDP